MPKCPKCGEPISSYSEYARNYYIKHRERLLKSQSEAGKAKRKLAREKREALTKGAKNV